MFFHPQIEPLLPVFISFSSVLSNSFKGNRNYIKNIVKNRSNFCISFKFCTKKLYPTLFLPTPWGAQICFYLALSNIELKLKYAITFEGKSWKCFLKEKSRFELQWILWGYQNVRECHRNLPEVSCIFGWDYHDVCVRFCWDSF